MGKIANLFLGAMATADIVRATFHPSPQKLEDVMVGKVAENIVAEQQITTLRQVSVQPDFDDDED